MNSLTAAIADPDLGQEPAARLIVFPGANAATVRAREVETLHARAAATARRSAAYVVPGLYLKNERLWLSLVAPDGALVLEQPATHLNRTWAGDLTRGDEITPAETPFGRLALIPDVDVYKGEVLRIAALQGAEIAVSVQVIRPEDYSGEMVLAGAWQQAQQNCLYIVSTSGRHACLVGPCEASPDGSGFLTRPGDPLPQRAEFSAEKRLAAYRSFPVFQSLNPRLYRNHLDELCR